MVFDYRGQLKTGDIILHTWSSFPGEKSCILTFTIICHYVKSCVNVNTNFKFSTQCVCVWNYKFWVEQHSIIVATV